MARDEVMEMTDDELRVKAGELRGWKMSVFGNWPWQMVPPDGDGSQVRNWNCPDYPHDIAAAMELFDRLPMSCGIEQGYEGILGRGPCGYVCGFGDWEWSGTDVMDQSWHNEFWDESICRAITRAFVFAMTQETV